MLNFKWLINTLKALNENCGQYHMGNFSREIETRREYQREC